jgi:hypothetical protein
MAAKDPEYHRKYYLKNKGRIRADRIARQAEVNVWQNEQAKKNRLFVQEVKSSTPCTDCGLKFHYCVMDFDHCRGDKKFKAISTMISRYSLSKIQKKLLSVIWFARTVIGYVHSRGGLPSGMQPQAAKPESVIHDLSRIGSVHRK